jgi:hypothetical protein
LTNYIIGLLGMWILSDGILSILLYLKTVDHDGKRLQSWKFDHSIRVVRVLIGIALMIMASP